MNINTYNVSAQARTAKGTAERLGHGRGTLLFTLCEFMEVAAEIGIDTDTAFGGFQVLASVNGFQKPTDPTKKTEELPVAEAEQE